MIIKSWNSFSGKLSKGDIVSVHGRRWFEKTNGNTYHSVRVLVNGLEIGRDNFAYGYGDQYKQTAVEILDGALEYPLTIQARERGILLDIDVVDVMRKKDL